MHRAHARTMPALVTLALTFALGLTACSQTPTPVPGISLQAATATVTLEPNSGTTVALAVAPAGGFTGSVTLSLLDAQGKTASGFTLSPASVTVGGIQPVLTGVALHVDGTVPTGTHPLLLKASGKGVTASLPFSVTVDPNPTPDFSFLASPLTLTTLAGNHATATAIVAPQNGLSGTVHLTLSDSSGSAPAGITLTPASLALTAGQTTGQAVAVSVGSSVPDGTYNLTLSASAGGASHSTPLTLVVSTPTTSPTFDLQAANTSLTLQPGNSSSLAIDVTPHQGFTGTVTLALADSSGAAPAGLTLTPATIDITGTQPVLTGVTLDAAGALPTGTYPLLLEASGNGASSSLPLTVTADPNPTPDFSLGLSPMALTSTPGVHVTATLLIAPQNGFTGTLTLGLTDSNKQPPSDISLSPATVTLQPGQATGIPLTVYPSASLPAGTYPLTLTATANGATHTAPFTLTLATSANGTFQPSTGSPITLSAEPFSVAVADVNRDGRPDIVTANYLASTLTILLGDGTGGFTPAANSPLTLAAAPYKLVLADLNHDGNPDIAAATITGVTVLLGDGTGGFTALPTIAANALCLAVGDLNHDGNPDIAVGGGATTITILLGDGTGHFTASTPISGGNGYGSNDYDSIILSDLNHDGNLDIAVANSGAITAAVALGDGTGNFTLAGTYHVASIPNGVAVADFNRDGNPDIATIGDMGGVSILLGDGTGTFVDAPTFPVPADPYIGDAITTGDYNGDGIPDIAIGKANGVVVLLGNGTAGFTNATGSPYAIPQEARDIVTADVNTDGIPDLVTTNGTSSSVSVLLGR